jgi:hypothetical protein
MSDRMPQQYISFVAFKLLTTLWRPETDWAQPYANHLTRIYTLVCDPQGCVLLVYQNFTLNHAGGDGHKRDIS